MSQLQGEVGSRHFESFSKYYVPTWGEGRGGGQRTWDKFLSFAVFLAIIPNTVFLVLLVQEVTNRPHHFHIDTIKREDPRLSIIAIMNPKIRPIYP